MLYNIGGKEGCGIVSFDGNSYHSEKRQGLVGDHFTDHGTIKSFQVNLLLVIIDTLLLKPLLACLFFADLHMGGLSVAHNGNLIMQFF